MAPRPRTFLLVLLAAALLAGSGCSNPKKPRIIEEPVIEIRIGVAAHVTVDAFLPRGDIRTLKLTVYRGGAFLTEYNFAYSDTATYIIDPDFIAGTDIHISARAYDASDNLLYFGYISLDTVNPQVSRTIPVVLNWSAVNSVTSVVEDDYIYDVCMDEDGILWLATRDNGVCRYDGSTWKSFGESYGLPHRKALDVFCDRDNRIWAGTENGAALFDRTAELWTVPDSLQGVRINRITEDSADGSLWLATAAGAWHTADAGTTVTVYAAGREVTSVFRDLAGTWWFGTAGYGAVAWDGTAETSHTRASGAPFIYVWDLAQPDPSELWFASSQGAVVYRGGTWELVDNSVFSPDRVYGIENDLTAGSGSWFCTAWNIYRLRDGSWEEVFPFPENANFNNLYIDADNRKWFTTTGSGLYLYLGN